MKYTSVICREINKSFKDKEDIQIPLLDMYGNTIGYCKVMFRENLIEYFVEEELKIEKNIVSCGFEGDNQDYI